MVQACTQCMNSNMNDHALTGCLSISAPATPPQSISALVLNSTSVGLSWQPPSLEDQNGVIIFYTVNVSSTSAGYTMISATTDTELVVSSLNAFTWYNFTIAAETSAGRGPFSDPVQRMTLEGSESFNCLAVYQ